MTHEIALGLGFKLVRYQDIEQVYDWFYNKTHYTPEYWEYAKGDLRLSCTMKNISVPEWFLQTKERDFLIQNAQQLRVYLLSKGMY